MITREQHLNILLDITCKKNNIKDESYKIGFKDGAHAADSSTLNVFETWVKYQAKYGRFLFHEKGFQDEEQMISDFKSWLGI